MDSYNIPVKIESLDKRRRMSGVIHGIAGFYLLAVSAGMMTQKGGMSPAALVPFLLVAVGAIVYGFMRKKIDPAAKYNSAVRGLEAVGMALLALNQTGMAAYGLFAWAALSLLLLFSEKVLFQPAVLEIAEEGIGFPGSPKPPVLPWAELENIIVRADFVTLFRNDQKFVQLELSKALEPSLLEGADKFGKAQIRKYKS